ncbi:MAG TPA: hypothetical protein VF580_09215 [Thermoanaerobaculia bacterium]
MKDALRTGFRAMRLHRRLAGVLWLSLVLPAGLACMALGPLTRQLDTSPFRTSLVKGWDSWAMVSWSSTRAAEWRGPLAVVLLALLVGWLLQLFLTGGVLRVLIDGGPRPVLGRVVTESVALFKVTLWATSRYLLSLAFWLGGVGVGVAWLLEKIAGKSTAPDSFLFGVQETWLLTAGLLGFFLVSLRFDLARIALARGDAPNARTAYRLAGFRLRGHRTAVLALAILWSVVALALGSAFTGIGVWLNPGSNAGLFVLILFRQIGFVIQASARIGFWATLLHVDEGRRAALVNSALGSTYRPSMTTAHTDGAFDAAGTEA